MWKKQGSWNFFHAKLIPNSSKNCKRKQIFQRISKVNRPTERCLLGGLIEGKKASPPALCFPRFAGFTNSDLWFPEEGGEWLAMEMEEVILRLIWGGDDIDY